MTGKDRSTAAAQRPTSLRIATARPLPSRIGRKAAALRHAGTDRTASRTPMNLSLATRIFIGYAVVLTTFGAVSIFSVSELHRNQQEIRLVSQGYLHLSQETSAIETMHKNRERDTDRVLE